MSLTGQCSTSLSTRVIGSLLRLLTFHAPSSGRIVRNQHQLARA